MGRIFLTSCGLKLKQESDELYKYLKADIKGKRAIIVTNATTTGHNERAIAPTKERLLCAGATAADIVILTKDNYKIISGYDIIYVVGGDIAPLSDLISSVDLRSKLVKFLESGGTYIGESAGAILLGKECKWYYDIVRNFRKDDRKEPTNYNCLNLTSFNILPHSNNKPKEMLDDVKKYEKKTGIKITPLNDGEWVELEYKDIIK